MNLSKIYIKPFRYDKYAQSIFDKEGNMALDVRGWGHIQQFFKNEDGTIREEEAGKFQDDFGKHVAKLLMQYYSISNRYINIIL